MHSRVGRKYPRSTDCSTMFSKLETEYELCYKWFLLQQICKNVYIIISVKERGFYTGCFYQYQFSN